MKIIDDKGRIFGLINYIDLFFLLAIIFIFSRFILTDKELNLSKGLNNENLEEVEILYLISGIKDVSIDSVNIGDVFKSVTTKDVVGEVIKKDVETSYLMTTDEKGKVIYSEIPDRFDMYLTIKANGLITDDGIKVANEDIKIGMTSDIQSKLNRFGARVYGIEYN